MSARVAVFASGGGSNLQALIDRFATSDDTAIALVVSDREEAGALRRAEAAGIATKVIAPRERTAELVSAHMMQMLGNNDIDIIALAGYLKLVPPAVTSAYRGRIVNIHPSLLPAFGGKGMFGTHVHEAVIRARCRVSGATVHYVDERYDEGAIIAQWPVPVLPTDSAQTLAARVLDLEHMLYPAAIAALAGHLRGDGAADDNANTVFRLMTQSPGIDAEMQSLAGFE